MGRNKSVKKLAAPVVEVLEVAVETPQTPTVLVVAPVVKTRTAAQLAKDARDLETQRAYAWRSLEMAKSSWAELYKGDLLPYKVRDGVEFADRIYQMAERDLAKGGTGGVILETKPSPVELVAQFPTMKAAEPACKAPAPAPEPE